MATAEEHEGINEQTHRVDHGERRPGELQVSAITLAEATPEDYPLG